jgi:hypothetical protein
VFADTACQREGATGASRPPAPPMDPNPRGPAGRGCVHTVHATPVTCDGRKRQPDGPRRARDVRRM